MTHPVDDARTTSTDPGFRASDADRQLTVMVLQEAVSRGLLTPAEGSERMASAWAAVHHAELPPLTSDLPPAEPVGSDRTGRARSHRRRPGRAGSAGVGTSRESATGVSGRGLALWRTMLAALTAMAAVIGGTGPRRRLRLGIALVVAVLVVLAAMSIGGHVFADGDFPRGGGRMPGGPGSGR